MAKLTSKKRKRLRKSSFALPKQRKYPIFDRSHGGNALARAKQQLNAGNLTDKQYDRIVDEVCEKYPDFPTCERRNPIDGMSMGALAVGAVAAFLLWKHYHYKKAAEEYAGGNGMVPFGPGPSTGAQTLEGVYGVGQGGQYALTSLPPKGPSGMSDSDTLTARRFAAMTPVQRHEAVKLRQRRRHEAKFGPHVPPTPTPFSYQSLHSLPKPKEVDRVFGLGGFY